MTVARLRAAALALAVLGPSPAYASAPTGADAAQRGARFLVVQQKATGSFFADALPAEQVAEVVAAIVAGAGSRSAIDGGLAYVRQHGPESARRRGAYAAKIVMGIVSGSADPRSFGGVDYVAVLKSFYNPATGSYDNPAPGACQSCPPNLYADALAALGVVAAGETLAGNAITYFRANQCADGGFAHAYGCAGGADVDTTSLVLSVLTGAGIVASDDARSRARSWLVSARNADGGFGLSPGSATNGNSTGLALSAIAALVEFPRSAPWRDGSTDPLTALLRLQSASGGFRYLASQDRPDNYATVQAVPGAAGMAYPIRSRPASGSATLGPGGTPSGTPSGAVVRGGAAATTSTSPVAPTPNASVMPSSGADEPLRAEASSRCDRCGEPGDRGTPGSSRAVPIGIAAVMVALCGAALAMRASPFGRRPA